MDCSCVPEKAEGEQESEEEVEEVDGTPENAVYGTVTGPWQKRWSHRQRRREQSLRITVKRQRQQKSQGITS